MKIKKYALIIFLLEYRVKNDGKISYLCNSMQEIRKSSHSCSLGSVYHKSHISIYYLTNLHEIIATVVSKILFSVEGHPKINNFHHPELLRSVELLK